MRKCVYHRADLDGICSAAIVRLRYPDCELVGWNYGDDPPDLGPDDDVIMVDVAFQPFGLMLDLLARVKSLVWIDHHRTAIEAYRAAQRNAPPGEALRIPGIQREGLGACALVWEHLFPDKDLPRAVELLARYDVWDHSDPEILPFQYGMRLEGLAPEVYPAWDFIFRGYEGPLNRIIERGATVLEWETAQNAKRIAALGFEVDLDDLHCIAANIGLANSQLFDSVWDRERFDAMLTFNWRGGRWHVSLYSDKPGVDCGAVCKRYGGGGHPGAAGFQCEELPFELGE